MWDLAEKFIRQYFHSLQKIYDPLPYPFKYLLTSIRGYPIAKLRYSKSMQEYLKELISHEKFSETEMKDYQDRQIREIVKYAFESIPYYQRKWKELKISPDEIKGGDDLFKLPVLLRKEVKAHWQEFVNPTIPTRKKIKTFTSGTTGSGLAIIQDADSETKKWAFQLRQILWAGVKPKEWRITMFGAKVAPSHRKKPPFWSYNYPGRQILLSIFHLSPSTLHYYIDFLNNHRGLFMEGFPTALDILARFILEESSPIQMKVIYTTGEPLYPAVRARIEKAFQTRIFDGYGMSERVGLIQECENGNYHLISDYGYLEVLDEGNVPVQAGKEGYLTWTGFVNRTMPFIRYRIGDKGILKENGCCLCGRPFPLVDTTITRDSDYLMGSDDTIYSPRVISPFLKDKGSIRSCQFIQPAPDKVIIRLVPEKSGNFEDEIDNVKRDLGNLLGKNIKIETVIAEEPIRRGEQGKIPLIISEWKTGS
jgi:phenylacetate-CoA ligase